MQLESAVPAIAQAMLRFAARIQPVEPLASALAAAADRLRASAQLAALSQQAATRVSAALEASAAARARTLLPGPGKLLLLDWGIIATRSIRTELT